MCASGSLPDLVTLALCEFVVFGVDEGVCISFRRRTYIWSAGPSMLKHAAKCLLAEDRSHYRVESYWGCQLGSVQVSSAMSARFCAGHFCHAS